MIQIPEPKTIVDLVKFPILVIVFQLLRPRDRGVFSITSFSERYMERFHLKPPFSVSVVRQDPEFGPQVSEIFLAWKFSPKLDPGPIGCYIQTVLGWGFKVTCFFLGLGLV